MTLPAAPETSSRVSLLRPSSGTSSGWLTCTRRSSSSRITKSSWLVLVIRSELLYTRKSGPSLSWRSAMSCSCPSEVERLVLGLECCPFGDERQCVRWYGRHVARWGETAEGVRHRGDRVSIAGFDGPDPELAVATWPSNCSWVTSRSIKQLCDSNARVHLVVSARNAESS